MSTLLRSGGRRRDTKLAVDAIERLRLVVRVPFAFLNNRGLRARRVDSATIDSWLARFHALQLATVR